jgi:hypothetical protein
MAPSHCRVATVVCGLFAAFTPLRADTNSVQGLITGIDGKPLAHAEVHANRTDAAGKQAVTTTDVNGRYKFASLPAGKYSITVVTEAGAQRAAGATATVAGADGQPVRRFISALPYQVKADYRAGAHANVRSHYVWKPGEPGSHIGGRWIKAADANAPSTNPSLILENSDMSAAPMLRVNSLR